MQRRWLWLLVAFALIDAVFIYRWYHSRSERRYDGHIRRTAERYGLNPALVKAVIWRESGFDPAARGRAGEMGLMQLREPAAREWADAEKIRFFFFKRLSDPETNIRAGAWYLSKLLKRYGQTDDAVPYALADYNAGRTHVLRWMGGAAKTNSAVFLTQMDFPGTQSYIRSVVARGLQYQAQFAVQKRDILAERQAGGAANGYRAR